MNLYKDLSKKKKELSGLRQISSPSAQHPQKSHVQTEIKAVMEQTDAFVQHNAASIVFD